MPAGAWLTIVPESLGEKEHVEYTKTDSRYTPMFKEHIWGRNTRRRNRQDEYMKEIDLLKKDIIFIPICEERHWNLAVVCNIRKAFDNLTLEWINAKDEPEEVKK